METQIGKIHESGYIVKGDMTMAVVWLSTTHDFVRIQDNNYNLTKGVQFCSIIYKEGERWTCMQLQSCAWGRVNLW